MLEGWKSTVEKTESFVMGHTTTPVVGVSVVVVGVVGVVVVGVVVRVVGGVVGVDAVVVEGGAVCFWFCVVVGVYCC